MRPKGRYITAALTMLVAFGAGHFMQNGAAIAARVGTDEDLHDVASTSFDFRVHVPPAVATMVSFGLKNPDNGPLLRIAALEAEQTPVISLTDVTHDPLANLCNTALTASVESGAMVALSLDAPCNPAETVRVAHVGLTFTAVTDENGRAQLRVPAMARDAEFTASFASGQIQEARVEVFTVDAFSRVALAWQGDAGLNLHAFENDAEFGGHGHVWAGRSEDGSPATFLEMGEGETLSAAHTQIISFPVDFAKGAPDFEVMIEVEITDTNCGKEVSGRMVELLSDGTAVAESFVVFMPQCDAVGDFVQLKNLTPSLTIAQN